MKTIRYLLYMVVFAMIVTSCQKELVDELANVTAKGTLQTAPSNDCLPKTVIGIYEAAKTLKPDSNKIIISVNVTVPGVYIISTDVINGFSFKATGIFRIPGVNAIELLAIGKPIAAGINIFKIKFDSSICEVPITVVAAGSGGLATFSLANGGTPANCATAVVNGNYFLAAPVTTSNTVTVSVNVTSIGAYSVVASGGGLVFAKTGSFATTGVQTITLTANGTPTTEGANTISFTQPAVTCSFSVNVIGASTFTYNCAGVVANGSYFNGVALTAANTITVPINVTAVGSYNITTTAGGMTFSKTGGFSTTGAQTVTLNGTGSPTTDGLNAFTLIPGACNFSVNVIGASTFTYNCAGVVANGSYFNGVALTAANTITVPVNVTAVGSYNITTTAGGMTFSKSGGFTTTGPQTVTLNGTGSPTTDGINAFTLNPGACNFNVNVIGAAIFIYNCAGVVTNGNYAVGKALTSSNSVTVPVNVTAIGSYNITTTAGGMTFSKTGSFSTTGAQAVTLTGSGTPTTGGNNSFTLNPGACNFNVAVVGPAVYTLGGAPGACTGSTVNGTYTVGSSLSAANNVTVQVNVTITGSYTITSSAGGMIFSKTGIFTTTGLQTITLNGTGTSTAGGTVQFTVGNNGCTFGVTVAIPTGIYQCKIDGALSFFTDRGKAEILDDFYNPPRPYLFLDGYSAPPNGGFVPEFKIFIDKNDKSVVGTGTYNELALTAPNGYRIELDYYRENPDGSVTLWNTASNLPGIGTNPLPFTIIITGTSGNRIKGTFSGTLKNTLQGGALRLQITEGVFDLPVL